MRVTHVITRLIVGGAQENTVATVLGLRRKPAPAAPTAASETEALVEASSELETPVTETPA